MDFETAAEIVEGLPRPRVPVHRGRRLYDHVLNARPKDVLELGTGRGGSAVYLGAALQELGAGHVLLSVDSSAWIWTDPTALEVVDACGLSEHVHLIRPFSSYVWFLMALVRRDVKFHHHSKKFDFIFVDGSKNIAVDGLAIFLCEKLLRPGGWLLMDDLGWNYAEHADGEEHYGVKLSRLSEEERRTPHLALVYEVLVASNAVFDVCFTEDDGWWGWARKCP